MDGTNLRYQYKEYISDFRYWEKLHYAPYVLYKKNLGANLSIDETSLSQGELYTIVTNKAGHGKQGTLVAMIRGTKSEEVIDALEKLPRSLRLKVKEITLDLSPTMRLIAKKAFPRATLVADRFHVQRLMNDAVSDLRVDYRWQAIDLDNNEMALAKQEKRKYIPYVFENGDTRRQLLARSRHIVMKHFSKWTHSQQERAEILFREYPAIEEAYQVSMELTRIYNTTNDKNIGLTRLARWYDKVERLNLKFFKSVIDTMQNNYGIICNYFDNRSTNASAESFNAKVKAFRAQFRGVRDIPFFIFRLTKLFA
ncbi:transposase [Dysgonomonas sp. PFB1-18]|uniref:ISAon1 family transposase n=1 Tax=unclassified Dysgonomonas TaxID=2630389 RepID=UPI0024738E15|nr:MULTISPECIES: transposase [unclassified Dysgonomonas]MDH6309004.1 transposase [Dysgonomonas sp. PF1-14]MDH6338755.1 transposase [Dysgonomonas sp. PF1-16]MDH6380217.1 transposase [Dysgonomonas sp. PFB1-18]MDH6397547.1 transposase [Dysgonomonas sp. PF1-23]